MGRSAYLRLWLLATTATIVFASPMLGLEEQQQTEQTAEDASTLLDQITVIASKFEEEVINSLTSTSVVRFYESIG